MSIATHLNSLYSKKQELETEIEYEAKRPMPNFMTLSDLKKKKLAIKTQIFNLLNKRQTATA